jgi:hypothetical protein
MYYISEKGTYYRLDKYPKTADIILTKIGYVTDPYWYRKIWKAKPYNTVVVTQDEFQIILKEVRRTENNLNSGNRVGDGYIHFQIDDTFVRITTERILLKAGYKKTVKK